MKANFARTVLHSSWGLVLVLAIPFAARAAGEGEIRNYIISINRLYESLDYELALNRIQLARNVSRGTEEEVTLSLYEGIILCEMGKQGPGTSAFKSALFLRPDATLPVQVAPKVEQLFESVRKQVKSEVASLLAPRETESLSSKTGQKRELTPAPLAAGHEGDKQTVRPAHVEANPRASGSMDATRGVQIVPLVEKREDKSPPPSPKKEASLHMAPRDSTAQAVGPAMKAKPTPSAPDSPKVAQKSGDPAAVQSLEKPDCGPKPPSSVSSLNLKDRQLWRLASMKHALCLIGRFQGLATERWTDLKTQMEGATTGQERSRISLEIDQFAREFIYEEPRWKMEQLEAAREKEKAEQLEAERVEAERLEAERAQLEKKSRVDTLDTSRCQPAVSADCERLLRRLLSLQAAFLRSDPPSRLLPIRELVMLGQEIRAALTNEDLQEAARALDSWQQRHLPAMKQGSPG